MTDILVKGVGDFSKAQKSLENFTKSTEKNFSFLNKTIIGVGAGIVALGSGIALGRVISSVRSLVDNFSEAGDQIAKTADRLGVGIEALQEFRFAAERSGLAQSEFDSALQRFSKSIGDAAQGLEKPKQAFQRLGISIRDAGGNLKPTEQLFNEFADALEKVPGQANKAALAQRLFGETGIKLINTVSGGVKGLESLRQEFRDLGGVISEDAARASEIFRDNLTDLNVLLGSFSKTLASNLLPLFNNLIEVFIDFGKQNRDLISKVLSQITDAFLTLAKTALPLVIDSFKNLTTILSSFLSINLKIVSGVTSLASAFFKLGPIASLLNLGFKVISLAATTLVDVLGNVAQGLLTLISPIESFLGIDTASLQSGIDALKNSLKDGLFDQALQDNANNFTTRLESVSQITENASSGLSTFSKDFSDLSNTLSGEVSKALNKTDSGLIGVGKALNSTEASLKKGTRGLAAFSGELQDLKITQVKSGLEQILKEFENFGLSQAQLAKKQGDTQLKTLENAFKLRLISEKDFLRVRTKLVEDTTKKVDKALEDQAAQDIERQQRVAREFERTIQVRSNILKQLAANPINIIFRNNIEQELNKLTPQVKAQLEIELQKIEGLTTVIGGFSTILEGAKGAQKILNEGVKALGDTLLGQGAGEILAGLFDALSKTPEEIKKLVNEFFLAIPLIINNVLVNIGVLLRGVFQNLAPLLEGLVQALIESFFSITDLLIDLPQILIDSIGQIDQFILTFIDQVPIIIEKLIDAAPQFIEALARALPPLLLRAQTLFQQIGIRFALILIQNAPKIAIEFAKAFITEGIPAIVKGLVEGIQKAFNDFVSNTLDIGKGIGSVFGFNRGGVVQGTGVRDSVPALLTAGELVVPRNLTSQLSDFLNEARSGNASKPQEQKLTINLILGEEQLANVLVSLNERGFRV